MKPGKERPTSSCFRIQGLRSGASPKKWAKSKTLGAQGMLRRPRALLVSDFFGASPSNRPWIFLGARPQEDAFTLSHAGYEETSYTAQG